MPITLGCPSCGKRFRARDESAGKRVKCPYCAAAVPVPTAEEAAAAGAPTSVLPPAAPAAAPSRGSTAPVASPESWGATPAPADRNPFTTDATSPPPAAPVVPRRADTKSKPAPAAKPAAKPATPRSPEQLTAAAWRKTRAGLCWVLFGLFLLTIPGFVGFAKTVYEQRGHNLPAGDGWVSIPAYVNDGPNTILRTKTEQLNVGLYALPVLLGGLFLTFGRLTAGAAPRSSGAGGLFALSGLFTLLALAGLVVAAAAGKQGWNFQDPLYYYAGGVAFLVCGGLAEFWFLTGLTAGGLALKRPGVARAVGAVGFFFALAAAVPTIGWTIYADPQYKLRPSPLTDDWRLYEQAALMLGWLLLFGVYWRAVRGLRVAVREYLDANPTA